MSLSVTWKLMISQAGKWVSTCGHILKPLNASWISKLINILHVLQLSWLKIHSASFGNKFSFRSSFSGSQSPKCQNPLLGATMGQFQIDIIRNAWIPQTSDLSRISPWHHQSQWDTTERETLLRFLRPRLQAALWQRLLQCSCPALSKAEPMDERDQVWVPVKPGPLSSVIILPGLGANHEPKSFLY